MLSYNSVYHRDTSFFGWWHELLEERAPYLCVAWHMMDTLYMFVERMIKLSRLSVTRRVAFLCIVEKVTAFRGTDQTDVLHDRKAVSVRCRPQGDAVKSGAVRSQSQP